MTVLEVIRICCEIVLIAIVFIQAGQLSEAQIAARTQANDSKEHADQWRSLISMQAREIETLRGKAQALELHLQLKRKPPPKRQALDPVAVKLKLVGAITRAMDEVLKNG